MLDEERPMGIYIHIPFCNKKCDYCDFVSYSMDRKAQEQYLAALFAEIDLVKDRFLDRTFDTIYIGGGTPSIVFEGFIAALARKIYSSFHIEPKAEFTIEVNPSSFTREKFFEYAEAGINRISVGVQCLDSRVLANHGRIQSVDSIKETFDLLKQSQFSNVNGDVMIGLPGQSTQSVLDTINFLIKHRVKHISLYSLQVEKHTYLYDKWRRGKIKLPSEEDVVKIYKQANKLLKKNGFIRYEISNFAKPKYESKHNMKYWDESEYLGLGVSAHSFIDGYRYYNTKRLDTFIEHMQDGGTPVYSKEYLTDSKRKTERIMLSLRTNKGLDLNKFKQDFNEDLMLTKTAEIIKLKEHGMITIDKGIMKIAEDYVYVSNGIISELI